MNTSIQYRSNMLQFQSSFFWGMAPGFSGEPDLGDLGDSHGYAGTAGGAR